MIKNILLQEELDPRKFGFELDAVDLMVRSQWQSGSRSSLYLLYRWIVAVFLVVVVGIALISDIQRSQFGIFFIYFTHWGIMINMAVGVLSAALVTLWYFHADFRGNWVTGLLIGFD